ncbi:MAG: 50S ribosomal protein L25/general stress protein Ctc [Bacteroidetes bacterium GWA2_31_9]|nr:MAG: 50S ribosomal protein L25/general stress protein Ctc [Bacteroidetes bacterium GWA2_31_9]
MKSIALKGNKRTDRGSSDAKSLRKEDKIPAVLYGGKESTHFMIDEIPFGKIINSPNVYFVDLNIDGTTVRSIIKEIQYHPVTDKVLHVDFLEVVAGKPVTVLLPIKVTGTSQGVISGGKLRTVTRRLRVRGLADALPEAITIDITPLKIGQSIKVGDIKVSGLTLLDAANAVVVAVKMSRAAVAGASVEEEEVTAEATPTEAAAE